jgi:hypothetical protein
MNTPEDRGVPPPRHILALAGFQQRSELGVSQDRGRIFGDRGRAHPCHRVRGDLALLDEPLEQLLRRAEPHADRGRLEPRVQILDEALDVLARDRVHRGRHPPPNQEVLELLGGFGVGLDGPRRWSRGRRDRCQDGISAGISTWTSVRVVTLNGRTADATATAVSGPGGLRLRDFAPRQSGRCRAGSVRAEGQLVLRSTDVVGLGTRACATFLTHARRYTLCKRYVKVGQRSPASAPGG